MVCFKGVLQLLVWCLILVISPIVCAQPQEIKEAVATLEVEGGRSDQKRLTLPHKWDSDYPGQNGRARYVMTLPASPAGDSMALYFARMGNQVEIQVNGEVLARRGVIGNASYDATKTPFWLSVPASVLNENGPSELVVIASLQGNRWGGLSPPLWGTEAQIYPIYYKHYVWRNYVALAVIISLFCVGSISAALWWVQRDEVFGWFALAAAFGAVRFGGIMSPEASLPWPLLGGLMGAALQAHSLCMARFFLAVLGFKRPWLNPTIFTLLVMEAGAAIAAFLFGEPKHWNWLLISLLPLCVPAAYFLIRQAIVERSKEAMFLACSVMAAIIASLRDFIVVRVLGEGPGMIFWLPLMTLFFIAMAGWIIIQRFTHQMQLNRDLVATLDGKVLQSEAELRSSYAEIQEQRTRAATLAERQRITRDIHDGVGAQLVGLLSLIEDEKTNRQVLGEQAKAVLDELRIAVDSMQPAHQDLTTVLATLRYRVQPRLEAIGVELRWHIGDLPDPDMLSPTARAQIQRIMQEALANVIRHARASQVSIHATFGTDGINQYHLTIEDNGQGFIGASTDRVGHGLLNMQARAEALGGRIEVKSAPSAGTRITLYVPTQAQTLEPHQPGRV